MGTPFKRSNMNNKHLPTFYITDDCIACDTCPLMAPHHFALNSTLDQAIILQQPQTEKDINTCQKTKIACPVEAIGVSQ